MTPADPKNNPDPTNPPIVNDDWSAKPVKKRRKWPWVVLGLLALLILLVLLAPGGLLLAQTTRSTRPLELALDLAIDRIAECLTTSTRTASRRVASRRPRR